MGHHQWSGIYTPLMRLGAHSRVSGGLVGAPSGLLHAAADYCETRARNFMGRVPNHRAKNAVKFYSKWLHHIRHELRRIQGMEMVPDEIARD